MEVDSGQGEYFSSYEDLEIHRLMLEDTPRTEAYREAILGNKSFFEDKIVMDVGCGTGILSIFCAQAGAKKVYAVEASNLANLAKEIVKENNFQDVIEVIHSKVEDLELPNIKVDAIVSEWMGFYLLHEGMLDSVLIARDKFLKEGGAIFPEVATVYVAPCSLPSLYNKWDNNYGVSLSTFAKQLRSSKYNKPEITTVHPEDIIGQKVAICWVYLKENAISELDMFAIQHVVGATKAGAMYQGLCLWFECKFPDFANGSDRVVLDTSPNSPPTHWKQTVIVLPQEQEVDLGEPIAFTLEMNRDKINRRRYNLQVTMQDPDEVEHPLPCTCDMTKCILVKSFMHQHDDRTLDADDIDDTVINNSSIKDYCYEAVCEDIVDEEENVLQEDVIEDDCEDGLSDDNYDMVRQL